jgi:hypothetical protein
MTSSTIGLSIGRALTRSGNIKPIFRGMGDAKYQLFSSAQLLWLSYEMEHWKRAAPRLQYQDFVTKMIRQALKKDSLSAKFLDLYGLQGAQREFTCLSLLQHYGSSTPLLDWSYNFRVALFFATEYATVPPVHINNEPDDYFAIYVITEETYRVSTIELQPSVATCFPPACAALHTGQLLRLTDINLDDGQIFDPARPFKEVLMAAIYNQNIIPQEGLFIFNPHTDVPMEKLFDKPHRDAVPTNEAEVPHSGFIVYNIHKRLGQCVKRKIAMEGFTRNYMMPDLTTYANGVKETVLNELSQG